MEVEERYIVARNVSAPVEEKEARTEQFQESDKEMGPVPEQRRGMGPRNNKQMWEQ